MNCPLPRIKRRCCLPLLILAFAGAPGEVVAGSGSLWEKPEYIHRVWQGEEGLPNPVTRAVTQSRDGYLWIATDEGLLRFDGARFLEFEAKTGSDRADRWLVGLTETSDGSVWTSSCNGGVTRIREGQVKRYTTDHGLPSDSVLDLFEDSRGTLWAGSAGGLSRFEDERFHLLPAAAGWPGYTVRTVAEDAHGALWLGTPHGLFRWQAGQFTRFTSRDRLLHDSILTLHVAPDRSLWVGSSGGLTVLDENLRARHYTIEDGLADRSVRAIHQDREGTVWIGSNGGLQQYRNGRIVSVELRNRATPALVAPIPDFVFSIFEDREGSLWIGTNLGLHQINSQRFRLLSKRHGLPHHVATSVYEDKGGFLWVGTWGGGLARISDDAILNWTVAEGLASDYILALHQDRSGDLWIGTDGQGIHRLSTGDLHHYSLGPARPQNVIHVIYQDRRGRLWAGTSESLRLYDGTTFIDGRDLFGLEWGMVKALAEDDDGLWIASSEGLSRIEGGQAIRYTPADGLPHGMINTIHLDATGVLWVATEPSGLYRRDPDRGFTALPAGDGLLDKRILHILEDEAGVFWMSTRGGILRVARQELEDYALGRIPAPRTIHYGRADGLKRAQCNGLAQPSGWKGRNNRLWFPTTAGLVCFDPATTPVNNLPPPVLIERVVVDGKETPMRGSLRLPAGTRQVQIEYTATSFEVPEKVLFRHRLEGFEEEWQEGGRRRVAHYQNLPPGDYRFRVTAANNDGLWSETGAALALSQAPRMHQSAWFLLLTALLAIAAGAGVYGLRLRQARQRERTLQELVDNRTEELLEEIAVRRRAQQRTATFSALGQQLSLASCQKEAARIIVETADQLIGWDSCCLFAYSAAEDKKVAVLGYDIIDGRRSTVPLEQFHPEVPPLSRRAIKEGPQIVLRKRAADEPRFAGFGNCNRPSASLLFAPIRDGSEVVGIVSIQSYTVNAYDQSDLDTLQTLADYCGGAFARIRREEAMRESQPRMMHQERLAAIGELSAGAAHEFNNILTVIQGNSNLLLGEKEKLEPAMRRSLEDISLSVERAANLTRQLLTFSRKQYMRTEVLDLNAAITQTAGMLQRLLGEKIRVSCRLAENLHHIRADPGMIEQLLINLAVNAQHAMAEGGELTLATNNVGITPFHPHPEARPGPFACLTISDTGCGMDPSTLSRIFEPFFTTKNIGEGTGLGLASVYGIAKQHQGWIEVESQLGRGSTFTIYLPATPEPLSPRPKPNVDEPMPEGTETILVVEDEPGVRNLVRSILGKRNYVVLEAANAAEALEVWRRHEGRIDLLLTDIVLPEKISGWDLAARLTALKPQLQVIYTSGYASEGLEQEHPGQAAAFLPKPYPPRKLVDLVHQRLHLQV